MSHAERLDAAIVHSRDNGFDYFGFKTLERSYLLRIEGLIVERPQVSHLNKKSGISSRI
jgi:ribonucleotide reductase alpha subunit